MVVWADISEKNGNHLNMKHSGKDVFTRFYGWCTVKVDGILYIYSTDATKSIKESRTLYRNAYIITNMFEWLNLHLSTSTSTRTHRINRMESKAEQETEKKENGKNYTQFKGRFILKCANIILFFVRAKMQCTNDVNNLLAVEISCSLSVYLFLSFFASSLFYLCSSSFLHNKILFFQIWIKKTFKINFAYRWMLGTWDLLMTTEAAAAVAMVQKKNREEFTRCVCVFVFSLFM